MEVFDEDKAVAYILSKLKTDGTPTKKYTHDDILEVIDIIWDYYEDNGFLDLDLSLDEAADTDTSADQDALVNHVIKMIRKDKSTQIDIADVPAIVNAELDYEKQCDEL